MSVTNPMEPSVPLGLNYSPKMPPRTRAHSASREGPLWEVGVDTGGTFTDCVARKRGDPERRAKVLSSSALRATRLSVNGNHLRIRLATALSGAFAVALLPGFRVNGRNGARILRVAIAAEGELLLQLDGRARVDPTRAFIDLVSPWEAPILATRVVLERATGEPLDDCRICVGTTRGTNALLERATTPVVLVVNEGLEDIVRIGDQRRLDIFARAPTKAPPLERASIGVSARVAASGTVIAPLDDASLRRAALRVHQRGIRAAAVALLHADASRPKAVAQERRVARILRGQGFEWVTLSHECGASSRYEPRARSALVDASLSGPVGEFVESIQRSAGGARIFMMTSAGGLTPSSAFHPRESLLSGPAGGVLGAASLARACGVARCITLDMGGTSADVARLDGAPELKDETTVGTVTMAGSCVAVESVAAGGGSILWGDGGSLRVGPRSAGANPGPACYGAGGPLTLTDANLLLGRIDPSKMPIPLDAAAARRRAREVHRSLRAGGRRDLSERAMLEAFVALADETMANAIRTVTIRKGFDPRDHALVAFGGSGALHACAVAQRLGISTVLYPQASGVLCAQGISRAPLSRVVSITELAPLGPDISRRLARACAHARAELRRLAPIAARRATIHARALVRIKGQEESLDLALSGRLRSGTAMCARLRTDFAKRFAQVYGYPAPRGVALELERLRVVAELTPPAERDRPGSTHANSLFTGPCSLTRSDSSAFVAPGWRARVGPLGTLVMTRARRAKGASEGGVGELLASRLASIATDMGEQLRRTAISPNVKDRLDYSCGLLDARGVLMVNAPHIPIHLGALGECVRAVMRVHRFARGDTVIVNHPRLGGSHLPDFTAISPIFAKDGPLLAFAANRAHHAEVGGTRPGSMPPDATTLEEEGCVLEPTLVVERGRDHFDRLERALAGGRWPSRLVHDNLMDARAQVAANALAAALIPEIVRARGAAELTRCAARLRKASSDGAARAIASLPFDETEAEEFLDDGSPLRVRLARSRDRRRLTVDFAGSSAQHPRNLNAPSAVTRAAVMYTLRVLVGESLGADGPAFPLNEGLLDPIDLRIPACSILAPDFSGPPSACPACAIGQTETSQRLVDLLWRALGMAACSQGTINNLLFGNDRYGFYETIAGGAGATELGPGESGIHTHISNTRITDAEVLERRYGVRLDAFRIRKGSGGSGRHKGGDGLVRRIRFHERVELSFLSQHRKESPYGLNGASPGTRGAQRILRANGRIETLPGIAAATLHRGDAIEIETPGGGGYGRARPSSS